MMDIPVSQLRKIESNHQKDSDRCKLEMLQYWLDSNSDAAWNEIVQALEKTDQPALATQFGNIITWSQQLLLSNNNVSCHITDIVRSPYIVAQNRSSSNGQRPMQVLMIRYRKL